jgi:hypothetical protein
MIIVTTLKPQGESIPHKRIFIGFQITENGTLPKP